MADWFGPSIKIRQRTRRGYSREAVGYTEWVEYQLVRGNKIVGRYGLRDQAEKAMAELITATTKPTEST